MIANDNGLINIIALSTGHIEFVHKPRSSVCVEPSHIAVLNCDVMATPTAKITWLKNSKKIPKADHHYLMLYNHTDYFTASVLIIYDVTTADEGAYTCMASSSAVSRRIHSYVRVSQCGMFMLPPPPPPPPLCRMLHCHDNTVATITTHRVIGFYLRYLNSANIDRFVKFKSSKNKNVGKILYCVGFF